MVLKPVARHGFLAVGAYLLIAVATLPACEDDRDLIREIERVPMDPTQPIAPDPPEITRPPHCPREKMDAAIPDGGADSAIRDGGTPDRTCAYL